jgi:protein phosphatase
MALKVKFPNRITMLRGNHEDKSIGMQYGFFAECRQRLESQYETIFSDICEMFEWLPLAAIIESPKDKILCCHGGIGRSFPTASDIMKIDRPSKCDISDCHRE